MLEQLVGTKAKKTNSQTVLLMHFDTLVSNSFIDSSQFNCPIATGSGVGLTTATAKFGGAGVFTWSGAGSGITATLPYAIGSQDFTYEVFIYNVSGGGATWGRYFQLGGENTAGLIHLTRYNGTEPQQLLVEYTDVSAVKRPILITSTSIPDSSWTHVALTRASGNWDLFFNGVKATYSARNPCSYSFPSKTLWIGYTGGQTNDVWSGNMDEIRLTIGKARYTANFTPPNAPFTS